jgi:hypothetical protein
MDLVAFCVAGLATWRLAHFLHGEDGPWRGVARLRQALGARRFGVFECFFCVSVWAALPAALMVGAGWRQILLLWAALSAAAVLIERVAFPATFIDAPEFSEDKEAPDVLRQD